MSSLAHVFSCIVFPPKPLFTGVYMWSNIIIIMFCSRFYCRQQSPPSHEVSPQWSLDPTIIYASAIPHTHNNNPPRELQGTRIQAYHPAAKTITISATADTSCQSCLASIKVIWRLGLCEDDLIPIKMHMHAANNNGIQILGAVTLRFTGRSPFRQVLRPANCLCNQWCQTVPEGRGLYSIKNDLQELSGWNTASLQGNGARWGPWWITANNPSYHTTHTWKCP